MNIIRYLFLYIFCFAIFTFSCGNNNKHVIETKLLQKKVKNSKDVNSRVIRYHYTDSGHCEKDSGVLSYSGVTGKFLIACLLGIDNKNIKTLRISSLGGSALDAIWAASIIKQKKLNIHIVDKCISSCANYLLPSAQSLTANEFAIIGLHYNDHGIFSRKEFSAMMAGSKSSVNDVLFASRVEANFLLQFPGNEIYAWYEQQSGAGKKYFDLSDYVNNLERNEHREVLLGNVWLEKCLPNVNLSGLRNIYMSDEKLKELYPNNNYVYMKNIRKIDSCN